MASKESKNLVELYAFIKDTWGGTFHDDFKGRRSLIRFSRRASWSPPYPRPERLSVVSTSFSRAKEHDDDQA